MRNAILPFLFLAGTPGYSQLGPEHRFLFPSTWDQPAAAILDADSDGDGDVVRNAVDRLWYYEQVAPGEWYVREDLGDAGHIVCLLLTDLDGDGIADLLFSDELNARIAWVRVLGNGTFEAIEDLVTGLIGPGQIQLSDLDGDGDGDLIHCTEDGGFTISWRENSNGAFGPAQPIHTGSGSAPAWNAFAAADLDNDADLDVAVVKPSFTWYQNNGSGLFTTVIPEPWYVMEVIALDVDADGDEDLGGMIDDVDGDPFYYFVCRRNNGDAVYNLTDTMVTQYTSSDQLFSRLSAADHEGDGDDDVYVQRSHILNASLIYGFQNDGSGQLEQADLCDPLESDGSKPLSFGHVDGDGIMDVVALRNDRLVVSESSSSALALNSVISPDHIAALSGTGTLPKAVVGRSGYWNTSLDGIPPLRLALHANTGNGEITHLPVDTWQSSIFSCVQAMYPADLDNDGDDDLICEWQDPGTGIFRAWMIMRSSGNSLDSIDRAGVPFWWYNIAGNPGIADMDGDGDIDLVQFVPGDPPALGLARNTGDGTFAAIEEYFPDEYFFPFHIGLCDVNNDGDPDYLWEWQDTLRWSANDGNGVPLPSEVLLTSTPDIIYLERLDINGDGMEDLLIVGDSLNFIYNNGGAQFSLADQFLYTGMQYELGDLDANGFVDVVAIEADGDILYWPNFGSGIIGGPFTLITGAEHTGRNDIALADMDGDGDLDVLTCSAEGAAAWLGNEGNLPTAIAGYTSPVGLTVYPNPMTDHARLVLPEALGADGRIELLDASGRVLRTIKGSGSRELIISRDQLHSGIYTLRLAGTAPGSTTARLVVR